ncbi:MAG: glucosidase, partial [Spirochaetales bacterium]|nr:glucosidase [Spirochaetales bacterium]
MNEEKKRLEEIGSDKPWKRWGPYLTDRQWGTVREDYTADGSAWEHVSHDMSRSKAYRWGEDGIGGFSDDRQFLCLGWAFWNETDPIIKERLFGLSGNEGNHGEDVKELYYYLDGSPTHSYMKMLYKYPHQAFPYDELVKQNSSREKTLGEYELSDTGVFDENRYFDIEIEYAKLSTDDLYARVSVYNRGPQPATLHILPQLWFRNTWSWGKDVRNPTILPTSRPILTFENDAVIARHETLGKRWLYWDGDADPVFCENETNTRRLFNQHKAGLTKDGINDFIVHGKKNAVDRKSGTKAALDFNLVIQSGESATIRIRLCDMQQITPIKNFDDLFAKRITETDAFYNELQSDIEDADSRLVQRQALAGMLWTKQFYYFDVPEWIKGDMGQPEPPEQRETGRNSDWLHVNTADIISMPDTWEYPWFAAWDLAFHCIPLAMIDPDFAKDQLLLLTREWYMHPNGQLPAYEWAFGDVNPPVHAWATWRVFQIDRKARGDSGDLEFLERVFHKLMLNFTWWVNRKDTEGKNIFQGGFLGLDNIGVFDRSAPLPTGGHINQSDGTSWMAMYSINLMRIALELGRFN